MRRIDDPADLDRCDGLVLPGVGAFREGMERLRSRGFDHALRSAAADGVPLIGVCLGMQLLFEHSDELGGDEGLALLAGDVVQLDTHGLKLPHIGWNALTVRQPEHPLMAGLPEPLPLYHVHSFVAQPLEPAIVLAEGHYGQAFPSVVAQRNVMGVQAHPEKSSRDGLRLLENFVAICAAARP